MKNNLIELHSIRAKFMINFYIILTLISLFFLSKNLYEWGFGNNSNYITICIFTLLLIISVGMYSYSFLGYINKDQKTVILKKPFIKKQWIIKFEDILTVEKERLFIARGKHIKISTYNKDKSDTNSYYILISRISSLFGSDDADYLWKEVLKRKKEIKENNINN